MNNSSGSRTEWPILILLLQTGIPALSCGPTGSRGGEIGWSMSDLEPLVAQRPCPAFVVFFFRVGNADVRAAGASAVALLTFSPHCCPSILLFPPARSVSEPPPLLFSAAVACVFFFFSFFLLEPERRVFARPHIQSQICGRFEDHLLLWAKLL